jgi:integrase
MAKNMDSDTARCLLARLVTVQSRSDLRPELIGDFLVFEALLRTGMRTCELLKLTPQRINRETRYIKVLAAKGSTNHDVPVDGEFLDRLLAHLRRYGTMLGHRSGDTSHECQKVYLRRLWSQRRVTLGTDPAEFSEYSLHSLRSGFALLVYDSTKDVLLTKQLLGHKSITSTMHYVEAARISQNKDAILKAVG